MSDVVTQGSYPRTIREFAEISNASSTFSLQLPIGWQKDLQEDKALSLEAVGPFRERVSVLIGLNSDSRENVLKEYVAQRTQEIEGADEITLKSRKGPEQLDQLRSGTYRIRWLIDSGGGPLSVVDYLVFEEDVLYLIRFFIGTEADTAYEKLMGQAVSSFRLLAETK